MSEITVVFRGPRTAQILDDLGRLDQAPYIVSASIGDLMARPGDVTPSQLIALVREQHAGAVRNGNLIHVRVVVNGAVVRPLVTVVASLERLRDESPEFDDGPPGIYRYLVLTYVEVKRGGGVTEIGIPV